MKTNKISLAMMIIAFMVTTSTFSQAKVTVKGSDTMVILSQKWAELYMKSNPGASIQVTGGGSGVGITALINGTTDIANSSRPMKQTEIEKLKARYNTLGVQIPCAKDGITIFLNEANKVQELTIKQLSDIYTGKIRNWKELGGNDAEIRLYGRENSSGTYTYFHDEVVKSDYATSVQSLPGTAAVVNAVKKDVNGIGYGGSAYAQGVKHAKVKKEAGSTAYLPTPESVGNGDYPITRYLYMYLRNRPTGETKKFIDWILSREGQMVVTEVGYFPYK
ncbi:MAG TPA: phosphate ABC transporter substrate-binding protein [Bacteroidales bacterium]|nr:phosphate ABC transporter substrate-binding protein [Bacteroidales bacterium]HPT22572.1 phosphate ABC transporter substrate-binding protein [Bacteroidales bacterium]